MAESGFLLAEIRASSVKTPMCSTWPMRASTTSPGRSSMARFIPCRSCRPPAASRAEQDVVVGGPLCESGDIFTQEEGGFVVTRRLPDARVGDLLVIHCVGAYGFTMSSNYNSKPLAAEVLLDAGQAHLIRRRQTFEDLIRGEMIP